MPVWLMYQTGKTQVWVSLYRNRSPEQMQRRGNHFMDVLARLRPHVTVEQAHAELNGIAKRIKRQNPDVPTGADVVVLKDRVGCADASIRRSRCEPSSKSVAA